MRCAGKMGSKFMYFFLLYEIDMKLRVRAGVVHGAHAEGEANL